MKQGADLLEIACRRLAAFGMPACIKDSELRYVRANAAYAALVGVGDAETLPGFTDDEIFRRPLGEDRNEAECRAVVYGDDATLAFEAISDALFDLNIERFITEDGHIFLYEYFSPHEQAVAFTPNADNDPVPPASNAVQLLSEQDDLGGGTELKLFLEHVIDKLDVGIMIIDPQYRIIYVNECLQQLYMPYAGLILPGEQLEDMLRRAAAGKISKRLVDEPDLSVGEWASDTVKSFWEKDFNELDSETGDGRWLRLINRRFANGYRLGVRFDISELRQREILLRQQMDEVLLYKAILDELQVPIFARDENHKLIYSNDTSCQFLGKPFEDIAGTDEFALFGDGAAPFREENERILSTGEVSIGEREAEAPDGSDVILASKISRAVLPDGKRYIIGSMMDVTRLKDREAQLEEARHEAENARLDLLEILNSFEAGVYVINRLDQKVELANRTVLNAWQNTEYAGVVGHKFDDLLDYSLRKGGWNISPADQAAEKKSWAEQVKTGFVPLRETTFANGTSLLLQGRLLSADRMLLTYTNISELRQRDREIDEAKAQLAEAGSLMNEALAALDQGMMLLRNSKILVCNEAVARLLNVPLELIEPGQEWTSIYAHCAERGDFGDEPYALAERISAAAEKGDLFTETVLIEGKRWIQYELRPIGNGRLAARMLDVTETRERQRELEELLVRAENADNAKSNFLASVSHEIRTPMNGVLGIAELLARSELDTRQKTFVDAIAKSGKAVLTVISDILDFSRLERNQVALKLSNFDPLSSVEGIAVLLVSRAEEKDIELFVHHKPDLPVRVRGDSLHLRHIVNNLVSNAIKFTERGRIEVQLSGATLGEDQSAIRISVADTGIGIPKDRQEAIFEKFSRVDGSGTSRNEGMGLGLAITAGLVKLMKGELHLESEPGKGSTFTVTLPVEIVERRPEGSMVPERLLGSRILVASACGASRQTLQSMLEESGFEAGSAEDAGQALAIMEAAASMQQDIEAIVLNLPLRDPETQDLITHLRAKDSAFVQVPLIVAASSTVKEIDLISQTKVQAYLSKPLRSSQLISAICGVLSAQNGQQVYTSNDAGPVSSGASSSSGASDEKLDILIAEDNDINVLMYEQILLGKGFRYRIVRDGREAVACWRELQPAIVVMDVSMPLMDGYEAVCLIRQEEEKSGLARTPIIGVTAHRDVAIRDNCLEAGMDDYLPKPLSPERFEEKVKVWLAAARGENHRAATQSA